MCNNNKNNLNNNTNENKHVDAILSIYEQFNVAVKTQFVRYFPFKVELNLKAD